MCWDDSSDRGRKRQRYKTKKWLNTRAADLMTVDRLAERDPGGEVRSWLTIIASLARQG